MIINSFSVPVIATYYSSVHMSGGVVRVGDGALAADFWHNLYINTVWFSLHYFWKGGEYVNQPIESIKNIQLCLLAWAMEIFTVNWCYPKLRPMYLLCKSKPRQLTQHIYCPQTPPFFTPFTEFTACKTKVDLTSSGTCYKLSFQW